MSQNKPWIEEFDELTPAEQAKVLELIHKLKSRRVTPSSSLPATSSMFDLVKDLAGSVKDGSPDLSLSLAYGQVETPEHRRERLHQAAEMFGQWQQEPLSKDEQDIWEELEREDSRKQDSAENAPRPRFGSARGMYTMSDDFDEPLEDFAEYM